MRTQAQRKREADREYKRNADMRLVRAKGLCERCKDRPATQTHHVRRRSNHVDHGVENLRAVCLWCHDEIHREVAVSKATGWIVAEWPQIPTPTSQTDVLRDGTN